MDTLSYKTISANKSTANKLWVLVDAEGQTLGRLASKVAILLRGKHKPNFTPHVDCGDNVVVINASKVNLTGKKWENKTYIRYTGYPGGQRTLTANQLFDKNPSSIIEKSVKGMLPKNKLGAALFRNLYVCNDANHNQESQKPVSINLNDVNQMENVIHKIGRRKTAVARVYLKKGKGSIIVNKKDYKIYFPTPSLQFKINQPFTLTKNEKKFDTNIKVFGGGSTGQAEAIRLALSRAFCELDEKNREILKPEGLLTRDPRMVERKKFGQKKARKKFQFSKR